MRPAYMGRLPNKGMQPDAPGTSPKRLTLAVAHRERRPQAGQT